MPRQRNCLGVDLLGGQLNLISEAGQRNRSMPKLKKFSNGIAKKLSE